jgi:hypothetical protein
MDSVSHVWQIGVYGEFYYKTLVLVPGLASLWGSGHNRLINNGHGFNMSPFVTYHHTEQSRARQPDKQVSNTVIHYDAAALQHRLRFFPLQ